MRIGTVLIWRAPAAKPEAGLAEKTRYGQSKIVGPKKTEFHDNAQDGE